MLKLWLKWQLFVVILQLALFKHYRILNKAAPFIVKEQRVGEN